jgi:flagellar motility protein MotE (MotC chaperone)
MNAVGYIDVRPIIWDVAPKIPFIGEYLKEYLNIPEVYTLTVTERRKLELQQWQDRLDIKERELNLMAYQSELLSNDIVSRQQKISKQETDLLEKEKGINRTEATNNEDILLNDLGNTYQGMSPRKAAQIVAQLPDNLAVDLMKQLPQETRASILEKMDPRRAARLTESLANPK